MVYKELPRPASRFDKILLVSAVLVLAAALFSQPKEIFRLIDTELRFSQNWFNADDAELTALLAEFHENNPGVTVVLRDDNPDIIAFDALIPPPAFSGGQTGGETPADGGAEAGETPVFPGFAEEREIVSFINLFFYNITLLEQCGFDRPPKTRDDFFVYARKARETFEGVEALSCGGNVFLDITPWLWASGIVSGTEYAGEPLPVNWTSRAAIDALTFLKQLYDGGFIDKSIFEPARPGAGEDAARRFSQGKSVFFIGSAADARVIRRLNPALNFSVTAIPVPANTTIRSVFNMSVWKLGIPRGCEKHEDALRFVDFIAGKREIIASVFNAVGANSVPRDANALDLKVRSLTESSSLVRDGEIFRSIADAEPVLREELQKLWRGEQSPKEAAQALAAAFSRS